MAKMANPTLGHLDHLACSWNGSPCHRCRPCDIGALYALGVDGSLPHSAHGLLARRADDRCPGWRFAAPGEQAPIDAARRADERIKPLGPPSGRWDTKRANRGRRGRRPRQRSLALRAEIRRWASVSMLPCRTPGTARRAGGRRGRSHRRHNGREGFEQGALRGAHRR